MIRLYDYLPSGNGYKVRLLLSQLQIPFERIELDIIKGSTRTPEFLRKFPNGRIPAVEFDDGRRLFESNAIIWHFAETTSLVPRNPFERARVLQWMFFEQYSHEPYIAVARFFAMHPDHPDERRGGLPRIIRGGYDALGVMESHLGGSGEGDHPRVLRRGPIHRRGHRAVRLYARGARGRLRFGKLPGDSGMARAREISAASHSNYPGIIAVSGRTPWNASLVATGKVDALRGR
jgi:glutathione S-transferase